MNTTTNRITCSIAARTQGDAVRIKITSPRTGRVLEVTASRLPPELRGRVAQAISTGKHEAGFTTDELRAVTTLGSILMPATRPVPPLPINTPLTTHDLWRRRR